jgi:hypothetical protein
MNNHALQKYFRLAEEIDYNNKEGGRYAYLQLMSYIREIILLLQEDKADTEILRLRESSEILNDLVPLKFEEAHYIIFEQKRAELRELSEKIKTLWNCEECPEAFSGKQVPSAA